MPSSKQSIIDKLSASGERMVTVRKRAEALKLADTLGEPTPIQRNISDTLNTSLIKGQPKG